MDPKQLLALAQDKTEHGRVHLATAVSEFFRGDLSTGEMKLAGDILINLLRQAETDLREALSERLAVQEKVPGELIVFLANDEFSVAEPVLLHSPLLGEAHLVQIIASKPAQYWQAISQRPGLTPAVTDKLIDTGDADTALKLLENQSLTLAKGSMRKLARAAALAEELQAPLLRRPEVDADLATDLYLCVSQALRREIQTRFVVNAYAIDRAIENLVQELTDSARGKRDVTPEMQAIAKKFAERDDITPDLLIKTLRRGQVGFFIALLAERLGMEAMTAVRIVEKEGGRPLAVACKSMGVMKSEFASIFLLSRSVRGSDKIIDQRELAMALKCFDSVKDADVPLILKSWAKNPDMI